MNKNDDIYTLSIGIPYEMLAEPNAEVAELFLDSVAEKARDMAAQCREGYLKQTLHWEIRANDQTTRL